MRHGISIRRRVENGELIVIDIADVVDGQHLLAKLAPRNDNKQPIDVQSAPNNFLSFRPLSDLM